MSDETTQASEESSLAADLASAAAKDVRAKFESGLKDSLAVLDAGSQLVNGPEINVDTVKAAAVASVEAAGAGLSAVTPAFIEDPVVESYQYAVEKVQEVRAAGADIFVSGGEEAEIIDRVHQTRLKEQCFLMYHFKQLQELHKNTMSPGDAPLPFVGEVPDQVTRTALGVERFPSYTYKKTDLLDGPGFSVMPKLTMRPGVEKLFSATPDQLSNVVPTIKLFKHVYDENGDVVEIPFKFYNHTITEAKAQRDWANKQTVSAEFGTKPGGYQGRSAVGIKSFDWAYLSGNPYAAKRDIDATLVLYFQSMDELIRARVDEKTGRQYRYLDLIINPARSSPPSGESLQDDRDESGGMDISAGLLDEYDSSEYELKATVGWAPLKASSDLDSDFVNSVKYNQQTIFLTLTDHSFAIGQDGTFELTIQYKSRIEGITSSPKSNILFSDKNILNSKAFERLMQYERNIADLSNGPCADNRPAAETEKRKLAQIKKLLREETYKKIIENMLDPSSWHGGAIQNTPASIVEVAQNQKLIYSIFVTQEDFGIFAETAEMPANKQDLNIENITTSELIFAGPDKDGKEGNVIYDPEKPEETLINFFFLGDLLDMLMVTVFDTEKYKSLDPEIRKKYSFNRAEIENLRLLLGPMEFISPKASKDIVRTNIGDIPISVRAFTEFFHRKVIKKERDVYDFRSFIKDVLTELVRESLAENCFDGLEQIPMSLRDAYVSGPPGSFANAAGYDGTSSRRIRHRLENYGYHNPMFDQEGYDKPVNEFDHFLVIHMQENGGLHYPGLKQELGDQTPEQFDRDRGIPHLHIGRDRGLLISANFAKANSVTNQREARVENAGTFNPLLQLSDVYEVEIEMFGNTHFYPGNYLYLNPFGLGSGLGQTYQNGSISKIMGLGGYHLVVNTRNRVESGKFTTTVKALYETGGGIEDTTKTNNKDAAGDCPDVEQEESDD